MRVTITLLLSTMLVFTLFGCSRSDPDGRIQKLQAENEALKKQQAEIGKTTKTEAAMPKAEAPELKLTKELVKLEKSEDAMPKVEEPSVLFERIVLKIQTNFESSDTVCYREADRNRGTAGWLKIRFKLANVRYDVKKTDSLVSPIIGIIECDQPQQFSPAFATKEEAESYRFPQAQVVDEYGRQLRISYAFQNNKWVRKAIEEKSLLNKSWKTKDPESRDMFPEYRFLYRLLID